MDLRLCMVRAVELMQRVRDGQRRSGALRRAPGAVLEPREADLSRLVEATPGITLAELQTELQRRCGVETGFSTIHNTLHRIGLQHKESP
jgi:hypothetical protein